MPASALQREGGILPLAGTSRPASGGELRSLAERSQSAAVAVNSSEPSSSKTTGASVVELRRSEAEDDRALVVRAQAGDLHAFRILVERHEKRAFATAVAQVRSREDAREIVQEAFLRAFRNIDRFNGSSAFFTWLYRIVSNLCVDFLRRPARRETELEDLCERPDSVPPPLVAKLQCSDPSEQVWRNEIAERIQLALDALPPYHRGVILMRELEGMSYEQMAQAMQVSKGTIMSRLFHARQKLQRALGDCYAEHLGAPEAEGA